MRKVPTHRTRSLQPKGERHRVYDRTGRDSNKKAFYNSPAWVKLRTLKLSQAPMCERCIRDNRLVEATVVHHKVEIDADPSLRLDIDNLESLCASCHSRLHASK